VEGQLEAHKCHLLRELVGTAEVVMVRVVLQMRLLVVRIQAAEEVGPDLVEVMLLHFLLVVAVAGW